MHQRLKEEITNKILSIAHNSTTSDNLEAFTIKRNIRPSMKILGEEFSFIVVGDDCIQYDQLCEQLQKNHAWGNKVSKSFIEERLRQVLVEIVKDIRKGGNKPSTEYIDELIAFLENYSKQNLIYLPLSGIVMEVDQQEIGKITLIKMTDAYVDGIVKKMETSVPEIERTEEAKQRRIPPWLNRLRGKVCAKYTDIAEPHKLRESTEEELELVFDLMRYSIHMLGWDHLKVSVGMWGEVNIIIREIPVISSDFRVSSVYSGVDELLSPFIISPQIIERMKDIGIFEVAEVLKRRASANGFDKALLRGIHWFANAQTQKENVNKLLSFMTCLETFLSPGPGDRIANTVAEGVAFILATEPAKRKALKKKIKDMYGKRSGGTHGGDKEISAEDVYELRNLSGDFLERMIQMKTKLQTLADLTEWIEDQKFGLSEV